MEALMGPFLWIAKLTLFSFILTVFSPLRYTRQLAYIGILISGILYWGTAMTLGVTCGPQGGTSREAFLTGLMSGVCASHSGSMRWVTILIGATSVSVDLLIFALPLRAVLGLKLPRKKKIGVVLIFGVAFRHVVLTLAFRCKC